MLLKDSYREGQKLQEDEEEGVSSYWMTLVKRENARNWNREHKIALCAEISLEEAVDLQ
jgi:hypothetical protein